MKWVFVTVPHRRTQWAGVDNMNFCCWQCRPKPYLQHKIEPVRHRHHYRILNIHNARYLYLIWGHEHFPNCNRHQQQFHLKPKILFYYNVIRSFLQNEIDSYKKWTGSNTHFSIFAHRTVDQHKNCQISVPEHHCEVSDYTAKRCIKKFIVCKYKFKKNNRHLHLCTAIWLYSSVW